MSFARHAVRALALSLACVTTLPAAFAGEAVPYDLYLDLAYGEPRGPASFRDDLERELYAQLGSEGCFRSIGLFSETRAAASGLVLRVRLERFEERIEHELSVAQRAADRPAAEKAGQQIARAETRVTIDVQPLGEPLSIRTDRFFSRRGWRPVYMEDPAVEARDQLVQEIARHVTGFVCKGSPAKWQRWIERARARQHAD